MYLDHLPNDVLYYCQHIFACLKCTFQSNVNLILCNLIFLFLSSITELISGTNKQNIIYRNVDSYTVKSRNRAGKRLERPHYPSVQNTLRTANGGFARIFLEKVAVGVSCFFNSFWKDNVYIMIQRCKTNNDQKTKKKEIYYS